MTTMTTPLSNPSNVSNTRPAAEWLQAPFRADRVQATTVKLVTLALLLWGWATIPNFLSMTNVNAMMFSVAAVGVAAIGMAFVTMSGNLFMLSMGAIAAVSTVIFASVLHLGMFPTLLIVVLVGAGIGLIQGVAVGVTGANPIIATIAMSSIIMGVGAYFSGGLTIVGQGDASWLGIGRFVGVLPNQMMFFIVLAVAAEVVVERTRFGRELRLIGMNRDAASIAGLRIARTLLIAFLVASVAASLSGSMFASQAAQGNLKLGAGLDFDAIAAVLVGGVSIKGGRGKILDAAWGAVFLSVVSNILLVKGLPFEVQLAVKGLVVIAAVIFGALVGGKSR
ncbi:ABC transporter permease [Rhizobium sp. LjRoot254]|uniref:ABC transporter permease n=1 Tax=Rhizobium sp. LjRoot254 TaxID=3342297 RepID=UPI003ECF6602